jgi:hypothetical protein
MADVTKFSEQDAQRDRACADCGNHYSIDQELDSSPHYFDPPYNYATGCVTRCLACWLGCGPDYEHTQLEGNLLREIGLGLDPQTHLVLMPIARMIVDSPLSFPNHTNIYPRGVADTTMLNVLTYDKLPPSLPAFQTKMSGVGEATFKKHATIAFPCTFSWDDLWATNHKFHMEFIRLLSEVADDNCLNFIRYRLCSIELPDTLPSRAGQISSNHMMAGAVLYNALRNEGRIIAGDAFSHIVTKGLGLPINESELGAFPADGEVGHLAQHGLGLYTAILETENPTAKFTQAVALLEFLAEPRDYMPFKEVKKIIARYVAKNQAEYARLLDRFMELTGKRDPITGEFTGLRTRVVHMGDRPK